MAFQVPIPRPVSNIPNFYRYFLSLTAASSRQNVAAVTSDLWPSILVTPWKQAGRAPTSGIRDIHQTTPEQKTTAEVSYDFSEVLSSLLTSIDLQPCVVAGMPEHCLSGRAAGGSVDSAYAAQFVVAEFK